MAKYGKTVVIRCFDTCVYTLLFPTFFTTAPKATLCKILKRLFQFEWYRENEETIDFLDRELPELNKTVEAEGAERIAGAEKAWRDRMADYERDFLDPNMASFPADWSKDKKREKRKRRKEFNARNMARVKGAKRNYEYTKKQVLKEIERAKVVYEVYRNVKNQ